MEDSSFRLPDFRTSGLPDFRTLLTFLTFLTLLTLLSFGLFLYT